VLGLWLKKPRPLAGLLSIIAGATTAIPLQIIEHVRPGALGVPPILPALAVSLAAYFVGHLLVRFRERS